MRDMTVVLKYEIPAIRNSDFLTGNYLSEFIRDVIGNRYEFDINCTPDPYSGKVTSVMLTLWI